MRISTVFVFECDVKSGMTVRLGLSRSVSDGYLRDAMQRSES
jgi:hypothetical protein